MILKKICHRRPLTTWSHAQLDFCINLFTFIDFDFQVSHYLYYKNTKLFSRKRINISTTFITIIERDIFRHKELSNCSTRRVKMPQLITLLWMPQSAKTQRCELPNNCPPHKRPARHHPFEPTIGSCVGGVTYTTWESGVPAKRSLCSKDYTC